MKMSLQAVVRNTDALIAHDPRDISNALLSRSGQALMKGDFEQFASCFDLPHEIETFIGTNVVETLDDLRQVFVAVRHQLVAMSVTEMVRNCIVAEFTEMNTVKATHETRLMNGPHLVKEPYPCFSVIKFTDGMWKVSDSCYAIPESQPLEKALMSSMRIGTQAG